MKINAAKWDRNESNGTRRKDAGVWADRACGDSLTKPQNRQRLIANYAQCSDKLCRFDYMTPFANVGRFE